LGTCQMLRSCFAVSYSNRHIGKDKDRLMNRSGDPCSINGLMPVK
jgi:hypothetical protein